MFIIEFPLITIVAGAYLYLLAYTANMAPVAASAYFRKRGWWNRPVWERLLGKNKTVVGTVAGLVAAVAAAFVENELNVWFGLPKYLHLESVYRLPWPVLGLLMGAGALIVGDMFKSAVKRHVWHIEPGAPCKPWDDLDFGIGTATTLTFLVLRGSIEFTWNLPLAVLAGVLIGYHFNPIVNKWSHRRGIKAVGH